MASVNKLLSLLPLRRLECTAAVSRSLCEAFSVQQLSKRNATYKSLYDYRTKKKRIIEWQEHPENLNWAKSLLEMKKNEEASKTTDEEPHMLHVVYLIKTLKGRPWWEKDVIEKLGFDVKDSTKMHPKKQAIILKNVPSVNKILFEVKHLLQILPVTFPNGLPEHESDLEHTMIKSNGEMVVIKRLKEYEPEKTEAEAKKDLWTLELDTVKKDLDKKLRDYDVHKEYHKANYVYRFNQDGKEYRYNSKKDVPKYEW